MKNLILFGSIGIASGILFVNIYTSLVDARSWGSDIPHSIATAREYFRTANPGNFFRVFSPINQLLGLLALIVFWKSSSPIRLCLGTAFVLYVLDDAFTFAYFYPRNTILFKTAQLTDVDLLKRTWSEWNRMNWVRSAIVLAGLVFSFVSLQMIWLLHRK